jgi:hypothetical protein
MANFKKARGRKETGSFIALPQVVLNSDSYKRLSAHSIKLLVDLFRQYRGNNNGDFSAAWKIMHAFGWKSRDTLCRALKELVNSGLIEMTRQGGLHKCSLYAVTWRAVDDCRGKLDCSSTNVPSNLWRVPK